MSRYINATDFLEVCRQNGLSDYADDLNDRIGAENFKNNHVNYTTLANKADTVDYSRFN